MTRRQPVAGTLLFLSGEAGSGKTRLLGSISRRAERADFLVLRAAAFPGDVDGSGGILLDLVSGTELAEAVLVRASEVGAKPWHPLTEREWSVATLVSAGLTNREIAAELFLSPKTVSRHVEHILAKLGAGRRAEIASWATKVAT